ncbi:hypothetical protein [Vibrio sp. 1982]|uniref:hypothetical protein n=1 Tax=Vibrio sp. 1982 TaxID=3074586 RepID=UPI00398CA046
MSEAVLTERMAVAQSELSESAKTFGEESEDALSAFSKAVREFGGVVKGKISSFFNRKGAL